MSFNGFADQGGGSVSTPGSITAGSAATGSFYAADGTSALPSYSFTSEPTLGFWRSAAGNVTFQGALTATGIISSASSMAIGAINSFQITSRATLSAPAIGQFNFQNWAANAGVGFDVTTDSVLKVRTRAQSAYATVDALGYSVSGVAGASRGPGAVTSITVTNGIVVAIS